MSFNLYRICLLRFLLSVALLLPIANVIHIIYQLTGYETFTFFSTAVNADTINSQSGGAIVEQCIPGSLSYINLIMNITHRQWEGSLGSATSNITEIIDGNRNYDGTTKETDYSPAPGGGSYNFTRSSLDDSNSKYYQNFSKGAIYWKQGIGVHEVHGNIYNKWRDLGLERSFLGYPITDEKPTPQKDAYLNLFETGAIYWTPFTGAHEIHGEIYEKWKSMGLERSFLGYPITDERPLPDGKGSVSYFQGGAIMWTPQTGAYIVHSKDYTEFFKSNNTQHLPQINETAAVTKLKRDLSFEPIFEGIDFPTSIAFLNSNDILVLEKNKGTVKRIINGSMIEQPLLDVNVASRGERGMLGIAVAKSESDDDILNFNNNYESSVNDTRGLEPKTDFKDPSNLTRTFVFLYFTESRTKDTSDVCEELVQNEVIGNQLYRYELAPNGTKLINPKLLLSIPATFSAMHQGGKMLIGPDSNLYLIVGDISRVATRAQNDNDGDNANGTSVVYRLTTGGEAAQGNPFVDDPLLAKFYAYGIRNSFGLDIDPITGRLWDTENGEDNFDEINLVESRFNSGWTAIQGFSKDQPNFDFDDLANTLSNKTSIRGIYSDPEFVWRLTVGVTDIEFFNSDKLGQLYEDDLFVADIENENLYWFELNENRTELCLYGPLADKIADNPSEAELAVIAHGFGSITDIETGPDGYLYGTAIESYYPQVEGSGTLFRLTFAQDIPDKGNGTSLVNSDSNRDFRTVC